MARNDLMGLAALGALGLLMGGKKSPQDAAATPVEDRYPTPVGDDFYSPEGMGSGPSAAPAAAAPAPSRARVSADTRPALDPSRADLEASMTRGQRPADPRDLERTMTRGQRSVDPRFISPQQAATRYVPRGPSGDAPVARSGARYGSMSGADALAALDAATGVRPMDPNSPRGPNAADSTEAGRNLNAILNAGGPGGLLKGAKAAVGVAREFGAASPVQRAYNEAAALRRSSEGFSPAEALARKRLMQEASFEGGMRKGGAVKKKAAKPKPTASSRGDGIARRGKTRGKMV